MKMLTENNLIYINAYLIKKFSPEETIGVRDSHALNMCVESLNYSAFGEETYPTLEEKASILYINLVKKHCFHNANKRTAHVALIQFLRMNGRKWIMADDDAIELAVDVATWGNSKFDSLKEYMVNVIRENTIDTE